MAIVSYKWLWDRMFRCRRTMLSDMTPRWTQTENNNMTCRVCDTKTVIVHSGPTVQFQTPRRYECPDCGVEWELDDEGNVDSIDSPRNTEDNTNERPHTPIENDKKLGAVPQDF